MRPAGTRSKGRTDVDLIANACVAAMLLLYSWEPPTSRSWVGVAIAAIALLHLGVEALLRVAIGAAQ